MADEAKAARGATEEERVYPVERLIAEAHAFFGHPSHVAAGAFHGLTKQNISRKEAASRIEKWLETPVTVDEEA